MTRHTSATSIKQSQLLRWGGQMYYPQRQLRIGRREIPSLGSAPASESSSGDDQQAGEFGREFMQMYYPHPRVGWLSPACSGVSLVRSARCFVKRLREKSIRPRWSVSNHCLQRASAPRNTLPKTKSLPARAGLLQRPRKVAILPLR